jgi:hypothetical protein
VFAVTEVLALVDMAASSRAAKVANCGPRRTRFGALFSTSDYRAERLALNPSYVSMIGASTLQQEATEVLRGVGCKAQARSSKVFRQKN